MQKSEQELIDIADKMLMDLEKEYWQVQQHNINLDELCPENNQIDNGYQLLGGDDANYLDNQSDDEQQNQEQQPKGTQPTIQIPPNQELANKTQSIQKNEEECGEMVEIFPTEQWIPEQKEVNINCDKIKEFTLKMNLPIPDWVNNEDMLKNRIMELFGKK